MAPGARQSSSTPGARARAEQIERWPKVSQWPSAQVESSRRNSFSAPPRLAPNLSAEVGGPTGELESGGRARLIGAPGGSCALLAQTRANSVWNSGANSFSCAQTHWCLAARARLIGKTGRRKRAAHDNWRRRPTGRSRLAGAARLAFDGFKLLGAGRAPT